MHRENTTWERYGFYYQFGRCKINLKSLFWAIGWSFIYALTVDKRSTIMLWHEKSIQISQNDDFRLSKYIARVVIRRTNSDEPHKLANASYKTKRRNTRTTFRHRHQHRQLRGPEAPLPVLKKSPTSCTGQMGVLIIPAQVMPNHFILSNYINESIRTSPSHLSFEVVPTMSRGRWRWFGKCSGTLVLSCTALTWIWQSSES